MVIKVGSQMNPIKNVNIGDRVDCGGYLGVVKYVGLIEGYHNTWIGIDWDDHNRGKHNGTVQGIRYFVASAEQSGSFVRPDKVQLGRSIVSAITSRYGQSEEATAKLTDEELSSIQKSLNAPFLQLVGFEKVSHRQSKYEKLEIINLRQQNVSCLEGPELRSICPNLIELDVSKNLFTNWTVVFDVCEQLDHLQWLNVSAYIPPDCVSNQLINKSDDTNWTVTNVDHKVVVACALVACPHIVLDYNSDIENFMTFPSTYENYEFPNVKTLICSIMRLNWLTVTQLGRVYPNLEELRVPLNNIETLTTPDELFLKLKLLDLEGNPIKNWEEVLKLTTITSLQQLNVEDAGLTRIYFDDSHLFRNLKRLVISQNQIEDWDSISELNKLPSLNDLRFLRNPVLETESYATCIQLIIAKIGNLQTLNGAPLRLDERKGAEYDYIKKYGLDWLETKNNPTKQAQFVKKHRRYEELIQLHGPPEEAELMIQSKLIKVSLIDIKFVYNGRTLSKKLPPTILIQKLIMLAQRLFNLSDRPTLTYISGEHSEIEIELSDEGKELGFYSMLDGDKIIVST